MQFAPGTDEIALALTAEEYSQNGVTQAYALAADDVPVRSMRGMTFLPDTTANDPRLVKIVDATVAEKPARALDHALVDIQKTYGTAAAVEVTRVMEYPSDLK